VTTTTRGCKQRLFASIWIKDLLDPYLSNSATPQSTLSHSEEVTLLHNTEVLRFTSQSDGRQPTSRHDI